MLKNAPFTSNLANLTFLLLFPGFFLYHSMVGLGGIPPILGGFFSPITVITLPALFTLYIRCIGRRLLTGLIVDFWFWGFLALFGLIVALNASFNFMIKDVALSHLIAIIHFAAVFLIFRMGDLSTQKMQKILFLCFAVMSIITVYYAIDGTFYLKAQNDTDTVTYQGFARSYLVTFLVLLPTAQNKTIRWILATTAISCLYLNGARSEFVAGILAVTIVQISSSRNRGLALSIVAAIGIALASSINFLISMLPENRILQLMSISTSSSWESRAKLFDDAINTIATNPILGDYGSYALNNGSVGSYAHNIMSAWVDLGIIGFIYFCLLIWLPTARMIWLLLKNKIQSRNPNAILALVFLIVNTLLLLSSKSFTYLLTGAALGVYANYMSKAHKIKIKPAQSLSKIEPEFFFNGSLKSHAHRKS